MGRQKKMSFKSGAAPTKTQAFYAISEEQANANRSRDFYSCCVLVISICFTLGIFIWLLLGSNSPDIRFNNEQIGMLEGPWEVTWDEKTETIFLPYREPSEAGQMVTYEIRMPQQREAGIPSYNSLMISAVQEYIKVYLDGNLLYEYGYDQKAPFSDAPRNAKLIIRLPEEFEGKTLRIEKIGYYDNYASLLRQVYLGTKNALVFYMFNDYMPILLMNFFVLTVSVGLLAASFFFQKRNMASQMLYLSLFAIAVSIWLMLESGGFQFFSGSATVVANTTFIVFTLLPILYVRFVRTFICFQDSRYMEIIQWISFAGVVLIHFLQLTQIRDYFQSIFITHGMIALIIFGVIGKFIFMKVKKQKMIERHFFISCCVLAGFISIDLARFYIRPAYKPTFFSQLGVMVYFVILCYFAIQKVVIDHENSLNKMFYEQMAYTDLLTKLPNRNAFEKELEYYRSVPEIKPMIVVMDLNELKMINDTCGHVKGDTAICEVGCAIRECFGHEAHAFRIGGDEFCIISWDMQTERVLEKIEEVRQKAALRGKENNILITVAVGWKKRDEDSTLEQTFHQADVMMYENKRKMKVC